MPQDQQHVGIVGGGIVGICTALALLEQGRQVTLIDRDAPGQATSYGNAGVISPWSIVPQAMPGIWKDIPGMLLRPDGPAGISMWHGPGYLPWLARFLRESSPARAQANSEAMHFLCGDSVSLYQQLLREAGHADLLVDATYVHAFRRAQDADPEALGYRMRRDKGAPIRRIDAPELRALEPALSHDFQAAILIEGQARARNPGRIGAVLADLIAAKGGRILRACVQDIRPRDGQWAVICDSGEHIFAKLVMAAGIWSAKLLKRLGISVPLAAERGYHVSFPDSVLRVNNSIMDVDAHAVASSMEGGLRLAGIAEFAGIDTPPNERRIAALKRAAKAMFPDLDVQNCQSWMGIRPSFPDSLPLIQEFARHPGLIGAFGHSHYGLLMAPKTGRVAADIVTGKSANVDLSMFALERF